MSKHYLYTFFSLTLLLGLGACSSERNGPLSKAYHNTTAHYNAFFLGNEKLKELEAGVAAKAIPDYNRILPIFPIIDTATASGFKKDLEEIIKKASHPVQRHPTSSWTDDSYLLIGKSRFYGLEYDEAIKSFRYVNSTSQSEETRHEALVWLMRSFVTIGDLESAKAVSDIMKKQFLNKENATLLFLTRAQHHLLRKENELAIENLNLAIPLIEKKDEEARIRFILAQLYQETNQDQLAYKQFYRILRKNPPYELGFQSKLRLGQVTTVANEFDKEKINKYFRKLQKDIKNQEYLDKIFYEMARFELKQNKPDQALSFLNQSVRASKNNPGQKGYSYLLAGQIYYDKKQQYRLAQAYYDSAVQVLPPTAAEYVAASERRDILNEFAANYGIVEREDSLRVLASLSPADLDKRIDAIMQAQAEAQKLADARRATGQNTLDNNPFPGNNSIGNLGGNNTNRGAQNNSNLTASTSNALWYFDNPVTIGSAKAEFVRRWGNRTLQDNWRITTQSASNPQQDLVLNNTNTPVGATVDPVARQTEQKAELLKDVPVTPAQRTASDSRIEEALFAVANIYRDRLKEPVRAIETYENFLSRFPKSKHAAEVNYALYLLYKDANNPKQSTYANALKQQAPNSRFAKLVDQPDYLVKVSAGNAKARQQYESAYSLYEDGKYSAATNALNDIRKNNAETDLSDKIAFLDVLITAKTQKPAVFKKSLQQFIQDYPNSSLLEKAQQFLQSLDLYESGKLSEAEFDKTHPRKVVTVANEPKPKSTSVPANNPVAQRTVPQSPVPQQPARRPETTPPPAGTVVAAERPNGNATSERPMSQSTTNGTNNTSNQVAHTDIPPINPTGANTAPGNNTGSVPLAPTTTIPSAVPKFTLNKAAPHVVVIAYPKGHAAFEGIQEKVQKYNSTYNAPDKLTVESLPLNNRDLVLVKEFTNGQKAKIYAIKQKTQQSPLSKIRGIEFVTFVVSSENLPALLQGNSLEEYLTFYKTNY